MLAGQCLSLSTTCPNLSLVGLNKTKISALCCICLKKKIENIIFDYSSFMMLRLSLILILFSDHKYWIVNIKYESHFYIFLHHFLLDPTKNLIKYLNINSTN